jgi:phytoene synthase
MTAVADRNNGNKKDPAARRKRGGDAMRKHKIGDNLIKVLGRNADSRSCRELLKHGSHSFYAASMLLPDEYAEPITALYAFCRVADDAIDLADDPEQGLRELNTRLRRLYDGDPVSIPTDRAFAEVVRDYDIPYTVPAALLEGFAWDVAGRAYPTMSDTYAYATRVAGTVGAMMAMLMGVRQAKILSRACDLGVAMQLTNIARDVGEDARNGRVYLPHDRLAANGVDVSAWLEDPVPSEGVRATVAELLAAADRLYERAEWGIAQLPARVRPAMYAARLIYAEIGREVERNDLDSVSKRAIVSQRRKLRLLATSLRICFTSAVEDDAPPLRETRFLLDAVPQTS